LSRNSESTGFSGISGKVTTGKVREVVEGRVGTVTSGISGPVGPVLSSGELVSVLPDGALDTVVVETSLPGEPGTTVVGIVELLVELGGSFLGSFEGSTALEVEVVVETTKG
jgi:hypothetical protein